MSEHEEQVERLNGEIRTLRARLAELYAERKKHLEVIKASKADRPKGPSYVYMWQRVLERVNCGKTVDEIAEEFRVTRRTVRDYLKQAVHTQALKVCEDYYDARRSDAGWRTHYRQALKFNLLLPEHARFSPKSLWPWAYPVREGIAWDDPSWLEGD